MNPVREQLPDCRLLWVDAQPESPDQVRHLLKTHRITVRCVPDFETALGLIRTWVPHLLLLEYKPSAKGMHYTTFVYEELPQMDPYGAGGLLFDNPWHTRRRPSCWRPAACPQPYPAM